MGEYMTDSDLTHYLGKNFRQHIIKYSDIDDFGSIDRLLPGKKSFKIILLEETFGSGHWLLLLKNNRTIEYFNSYGLPVSKELDFLSDSVRAALDQSEKHLNILLDKVTKKYDIIYNKIKFQKMGSDIATCGRWVILRLILFRDLDMDLSSFISFINRMKKHFKLTSDQLVTFLVSSH